MVPDDACRHVARERPNTRLTTKGAHMPDVQQIRLDPDPLRAVRPLAGLPRGRPRDRLGAGRDRRAGPHRRCRRLRRPGRADVPQPRARARGRRVEPRADREGHDLPHRHGELREDRRAAEALVHAPVSGRHDRRGRRRSRCRSSRSRSRRSRLSASRAAPARVAGTSRARTDRPPRAAGSRPGSLRRRGAGGSAPRSQRSSPATTSAWARASEPPFARSSSENPSHRRLST